MSARFDLFEHLPRLPGIFTGSNVAGGRDAIEQMMRRARQFRRCGFRGPDVKLAVHRNRIAIHDLAVKALGKSQRKRGLSAGCRAQHNHQQRFRLHRRHRQRTLQ